MLILKIIPVREDVKRCRFFGKFIKGHYTNRAVRYNVSVDGCIHTVVELRENELSDEHLLRLFKAYSGKIIVPQQYENHPAFAGKLFDASPFRCLAAVSSLKHYLEFGDNKNMTVCIRISGEMVYGILADILPFVKSLTVIAVPSAAALDFSEKCYITYGVKPFITAEKPQVEFDIYADFTAFEENGRNIIEVFGNTAVLYPDPAYFAHFDYFETFSEWGISRDVICAAFCTVGNKTRS